MTSKIPPLLSPYIHPLPHESLTLLTSVLAANTNWLILRYLSAALDDRAQRKHGSRFSTSEESDAKTTPNAEDEVKVVLVSWLRDWEFWKTEARRVVGLDLVKLHQQRRFAFIDGLTHLFSPPDSLDTPQTVAATAASTRPNRDSLSPKARPESVPTHANRNLEQATPISTAPKTSPSHILSNPTLSHLSTTILAAITSLAPQTTHAQAAPTPNILLILDAPSLLLQTTTPPITSTALTSTLLSLRANVHATVLALPADAPLLAPASSLASSAGYSAPDAGATPLETENAAFAVGLAHQARCVLSCRMLGTGFAEDVSGVVRATRGGSAGEFDGDGEAVVEEGEWLYYVGGDGGVRVWGRGGVEGG